MLEASLKSINMIAHEGVLESVALSDYDGSLQSISVVRKRLASELFFDGAVPDAERDRLVNGSASAEQEVEAVLAQSRAESEVLGATTLNIMESVPCSALLFCVNPHQCDVDVFSAIRDCGLVFDGGVVVDKARGSNISKSSDHI